MSILLDHVKRHFTIMEIKFRNFSKFKMTFQNLPPLHYDESKHNQADSNKSTENY